MASGAAAVGAAVATGALTVASGAIAAGVAAAAGAVLTVSEGAPTDAAGATTAGVASPATTGVLSVSGVVLTDGAAAAAAAVQCSEIMFTAVTVRLFSAVALLPLSLTSWPTYALRSVLLVVILNILPVLSSATV